MKLHGEIDARQFSTEIKSAKQQTELKWQYDYLTAYLDFFKPTGPTVAQELARRYRNYPIPKKRKLFGFIERHIAEAQTAVPVAGGKEGEEGVPITAGSKDKEGSKEKSVKDSVASAVAATIEPKLEMRIDSHSLKLQYNSRVSSCTVHLYVMDIELLFSTSPFLSDSAQSRQLLFVSPNHTMQVNLPAAQTKLDVELPPSCRNSNLFVELSAKGLPTKVEPYFANSLDVHILDAKGQVKVNSKRTNRPVVQCYIKVYARYRSGQIHFYKDGYTDIRGLFDYSVLANTQLSNVTAFAILVLSDTDGALLKETHPPVVNPWLTQDEYAYARQGKGKSMAKRALRNK